MTLYLRRIKMKKLFYLVAIILTTSIISACKPQPASEESAEAPASPPAEAPAAPEEMPAPEAAPAPTEQPSAPSE